MSSQLYNSLKPLGFIILLGSLILVEGCSFAPVGENKFDCNRKDSPNEYCRSIKAIERSTQGELPETRYEKEFDMHDYDRAYQLDSKGSPALKQQTQGGKRIEVERSLSNAAQNKNPVEFPLGYPLGYPMGPLPLLDGAPVRIPPIIQRIYIKSYVDADDVLIQDQIIYKEIAHSKWTGFETGLESGLSRSDAQSLRGANGSQHPKPHRAQSESEFLNSPITGVGVKNAVTTYTPNSSFGASEKVDARANESFDAGLNLSRNTLGAQSTHKPFNNLASNANHTADTSNYGSDDEYRRLNESVNESVNESINDSAKVTGKEDE